MKAPEGYAWIDSPDPVKKALKVARHFLDISNIRPTKKVNDRAVYAIEQIDLALAELEKREEAKP